IGAAMGAGAGTDHTLCNMVVMKDSFETGMRMLSDMARHPGFAAAEIERQRQQMLSGLQVSADDPGYVADAVFDRLVYGFHPYGIPENGTPPTIASITRDDLLAFHARHFLPNNAILALVGDITAEEALAAATNTRSEATAEVLRVIVDGSWRRQRERAGDRELDGAKAYLTGSFPLTIETPESIAMQVVSALFYGLPLEELQNTREGVNAV